MLNKYSGKCFICGKDVPVGKGDIQSIGSLNPKTRKNYDDIFKEALGEDLFEKIIKK